MTEAEQLNHVLRAAWPAAARCLSPLGRRAAFPRGIPFQSEQARGTTINASIGQVTDGHGGPMPPDALRASAPGLDDAQAFLYSPMAGHAPLRHAWRARQTAMASLDDGAPMSLPVVTHGLTQGVSIAATLFADPNTDVFVPSLRWENYDLVFDHIGAEVQPYPFYRDGALDVGGIADVLARGTRPKAFLVLNFPSNPSGYTPTIREVEQLTEVLLAHPRPLVVLVDDAYQGMVWEPGLMARSMYWELARSADPARLLPLKADGATKELLFFPGRVGFVSHPLRGAAEAAMTSKIMCIGRATVGSPPGPSQAMTLSALRSPHLGDEIAARHALLADRYRALRDALADVRSDRLRPLPFNSGCFALVELPPEIPAEAVRQRLLTESVGVVAMPGTNAIRLAHCSVDAASIPELVAKIELVVQGF